MIHFKLATSRHSKSSQMTTASLKRLFQRALQHLLYL